MTESASERLLRKIRTTASCRYIGARRLTYHRRLSRWTTAIAAATLMILPIINIIGSESSLSEPVLKVLQFSLALFMLIYSLLVGSEDYSLEADKMNRCGLELTSLALRFKKALDDGDDAAFNGIENEYKTILSDTKNHTISDYNKALLQRASEDPEVTWREKVRWYVSSATRDLFGYLHYLAVLGILAYLVFVLLQPAPQ